MTHHHHPSHTTGWSRVRLQVWCHLPLVPPEDPGGACELHTPQVRQGQDALLLLVSFFVCGWGARLAKLCVVCCIYSNSWSQLTHSLPSHPPLPSTTHTATSASRTVMARTPRPLPPAAAGSAPPAAAPAAQAACSAATAALAGRRCVLGVVLSASELPIMS